MLKKNCKPGLLLKVTEICQKNMLSIFVHKKLYTYTKKNGIYILASQNSVLRTNLNVQAVVSFPP